MKPRGGRRDTPGRKALKDRRSPRRRGRMGTSVNKTRLRRERVPRGYLLDDRGEEPEHREAAVDHLRRPPLEREHLLRRQHLRGRGPRREDHLVDDVDREIADDAIRLGDARAGDVEALARRPLLARQAGDGEREVFVQRRELPVDEVLAGDGAGGRRDGSGCLRGWATEEGRSIRSDVGVEFKGVRSGVERRRGVSGIESEGWAERDAGRSP